jgi:NADPH2:quinone reductase
MRRQRRHHAAMLAAIHDRPGPARDVLRVEEVDTPDPGPGEVRERVSVSGVNPTDWKSRTGGSPSSDRAVRFQVPNQDGAGTVEAVGEGVDPARVGQRVMASGMGAAFGEAAVVRADSAIPMPEGMDFATASVFRVSYATMYHALVQRGSLAAGESVVVLGAGGAVGYAAIELAKALGARVIGSASTSEKRALALRGGADAVIDSGSPTWREDLKAANGGKPVDVVVDPVGGEATEPAFRSLAWRGRHLVIGFAGGGIPRLPINLALLKGAALVGVDIRQFGEYEPELAARNMDALLELFRAGKLHPAIARTWPLEQFVEAMAAAKSGKLAGRVVLTMQAD